ncbi:MAG: hypothetical protein NTX52_11200 [Planctomycetota bacterium]|nr:hypothetical protein [Planctomycetota bacterium]
MKVIVHCSLFYFCRRYGNDYESFFSQVKAVHDEFNTDGVYIDGLTFDCDVHKIDNKIANWEMVRRFRR